MIAYNPTRLVTTGLLRIQHRLATTAALACAAFVFGTTDAKAQYNGIGSFAKINSIEELTDGYYVITRSTGTPAMSNAHTGTFPPTDVLPEGDLLTDPDVSIVWRIETNGSGRTIYNEQTAKYVSYTGSSNNVQVVDSVTTDNQRWNITYDGSVFLFANAAIPARLLQYNASSPRFACYTSSQQKLSLYKLASSDATPPSILTLAPANGATAVAVTTGLTLEFDENVFNGTGDIVVVDSGTGTPYWTIPVADAAVLVSGASVSITLPITPSVLQGNTTYHVTIAAGAFKGAAGNGIPAIADSSTWSFTTGSADTTPPSLLSQSPAAAEATVLPAADLVLTFDEDMQVGSG